MSQPSAERQVLEAEMLERITPTAREEKEMAKRVVALEAALTDALKDAGLDGVPTVQGSVAKSTWLSGGVDLDCFILMDPSLPESELKRVAEIVGPKVLENPRRRYAQHPYLVGTFQDADVDLVPAYRVADAGAKMSAVDRTPFHTAWVAEHLDDAARAQVRLLKRWGKGVGIYGAETAIGGFSGYLLEVLTYHLGGFDGVLQWAAADPVAKPLGDMAPGAAAADAVLVVADPVDATRNCAAAVQSEVLGRFQEAAYAYLASPQESFFFPAPPDPVAADALTEALARQGATWIGLRLQGAPDRLDIVFPQFQRAARQISDALDRAGFPVRRQQVDILEKGIGMQWVTDDVELPAQRTHTGPQDDVKPNADRFRAKWQDHPDREGDIQAVDGRLQVTVAVRQRSPAAWLAANASKLLQAKHVRAAYQEGHRHLDDAADVEDDWAQAVADLVLDRRPWHVA